MNDSDKTKEQLIQEIELLRTLIDALPDRLYVKDAKSRFVICNKAVEKDSDLHLPENLTGKSDFDLFPPELAERILCSRAGDNKNRQANGKRGGVTEPAAKTEKNWSLCTKCPGGTKTEI